MNMMVASARSYTRTSLHAAITGRFGHDARFYTCSAANLTADDLILFLEQHGKFKPQPNGFTIAADQICQH
jgi:probable metal-binding protein